MVKAISNTNRKLLDFKQALRFHGDVLKSFDHASRTFFGESFTYSLSSMAGEYGKVCNLLESHREILRDLRETNDSLVKTKTNEIMKTLTIMTFIMMPLTLITGIFSMSVEHNLIFIRNFQDFFFVIGAMVLTGIIMFLFFKVKRWI